MCVHLSHVDVVNVTLCACVLVVAIVSDCGVWQVTWIVKIGANKMTKLSVCTLPLTAYAEGVM